MAEDRQRKSRVRGATQVRVRADWPYPIPQLEWIERLNFVRVKLGDRNVAILTDVSLRDPTYKTVRRWAAGTRIPGAETYRRINAKYQELQQRTRTSLVFVPAEIQSKIVLPLLPKYASKIQTFINATRPYVYRRDPPSQVLRPSTHAASRMELPIYIQTCDETGTAYPPAKMSVALIVLYVIDTQQRRYHTEVYFIRLMPHPSAALIKNQLDTWIENLPPDQSYKSWRVLGVWFSWTDRLIGGAKRAVSK